MLIIMTGRGSHELRPVITHTAKKGRKVTMSISLKILFVLLLLACLPLVAQAQQGGISGVVTNNGEPLAGVLVGAQIRTDSSSDPTPEFITARSDQDGAFRLTGLKPGGYYLRALRQDGRRWRP